MLGMLAGFMIMGMAFVMLVPLLIAATHMHSALALRRVRPGRVEPGDRLVVCGVAVDEGGGTLADKGSVLLWTVSKGGGRFGLIDPDDPSEPVHIEASELKRDDVWLVADADQDLGSVRAVIDVLGEKMPTLRSSELGSIRVGDRLWVHGSARSMGNGSVFGVGCRINNRSPEQLIERDQTVVLMSTLAVGVLFSLGLLMIIFSI